MPKISALPSEATLDGTELVPIVQSGVTERATTQLVARTINPQTLTEKVIPHDDDLLILADSEASNVLKKVKAVNIATRGYVTPQQYGAVADGVTDDYQAFADAYTAAVAAGHNTIICPPGSDYAIGQDFNILANNFTLMGFSRRNTTIRALSGATLTNLLRIGPATGTDTISGAVVRGITFDGGNTCSDAVVKLRNHTRCDISDIRCTNGSADGLKTDTATTVINTKAIWNTYIAIECDNNDANGMRFIGEKETFYDQLWGHINGDCGIIFRAFEYDGGNLTETTQCTAGTVHADDNTNDGIVFDGVEKYTFAVCEATQNFGWGIRFRSTDTSASGVANNNVNIGCATMRGNVDGGIRCGDSAQMNGAHFGTVTIIGGGGQAGETGIHLEGVSNVQFGSVIISLMAGPGIRILDGTPLGGALASSAIQFGSVRLNFNGQVNTGAVHSLSIEGSTSEVSILSLISGGQNTSGTNYEVSVGGSASDVVIGHASLTSASGSNGVTGTVTFTGRYELEGVEQTISGAGTIDGAVGLTDGGLPRADGTGGVTLQASGWQINDSDALSPKTNDAGAIGTTALGVSDLFFATGAVINYNNGAETITNAADTMSYAGITTFNYSQDGAALAKNIESFNAVGASTSAQITLTRGRGTKASPVALSSGDRIGSYFFSGQIDTTVGNIANAAALIGVAAENFGTGTTGAYFTLQATPAGSGTRAEQLRVAGSAIYAPGAGTTASAANAFLDSGSTPANQLLRSTSSLRYKRDIEDMDIAAAEKIVDQVRPIFYRSAIERDRQDWSHYGIAAEELALIDPRLVQFGYPEDAWETETVQEPDQVIPARIDRVPVMEPLEEPLFELVPTKGGFERKRITHRQAMTLMPVWDEDGNGIDALEIPLFDEVEVEPERIVPGDRMAVKKLKKDAEMVPDGVAYERVVVPLLMCVRDLRGRVDALEAPRSTGRV